MDRIKCITPSIIDSTVKITDICIVSDPSCKSYSAASIKEDKK